MVISFVQLTNILFFSFYHGKHSNLRSLFECANIHNIILEVDFRASAVLLLVLQLTIVQLILLMQDQKALVVDGWSCLTAEVCTVFVFFDERK